MKHSANNAYWLLEFVKRKVSVYSSSVNDEANHVRLLFITSMTPICGKRSICVLKQTYIYSELSDYWGAIDLYEPVKEMKNVFLLPLLQDLLEMTVPTYHRSHHSISFDI